SKQLRSKPSQQKVYETKFNHQPTQQLQNTTTKLKTPSISTPNSLNHNQHYTPTPVPTLALDSTQTQPITNSLTDNLH
ncbi:hypothetical protein, partial [Staphylococcus epidermidis]|uniref:hypothetical protein n=1 Tax=Staphylococcus epidermidis TaxID=1282 RepID=UPI001C92DC66